MKKPQANNRLKRLKPLLGTYVGVSICADICDEELVSVSESIFYIIKTVENLMSFYKEDSEISFLNKNAYYHSVPISDDTKYVLETAKKLSKITNGIFDITVASHLIKQGYLPNYGYEAADPNASWKDINIRDNRVRFKKKLQIDLGGIAKGYAVDKAMLSLPKEYDVTINAGGDIKMSHFKNKIVSIKDPAKNFIGTKDIVMKNSAVATSSYYYLDGYNKIVSPENGIFTDSKKSVSVFAEDCIIADALTKVVSLSLGHNIDYILPFNAKALTLNSNGTNEEI